ncbi:MAG: CAP domain-containing protein [Pseudomonadota bacterium]
MYLRYAILAALMATLAACGPPAPTGGTEVYRISSREARQIPERAEETINGLRASAGAPPVTLDPQLTEAARTHSRDMSAQNRPWHFGSDGSSPIDRVVRTGYLGQFLGENISETFETDGETINAWMQDRATRDVILDPRARSLGFSWFQEQNGKIWWTLVTGT